MIYSYRLTNFKRSNLTIDLCWKKKKMPVDVTANLGMPVGLLYKRIDSQGKTNDLQK